MLVVGLVAAGTGTMVFLRNALLANLDSQLVSVSTTNLAAGVMEVSVADGVATFGPKADATPTEFVVAVYSPTGELLRSAGGTSTGGPALPTSVKLENAVTSGPTPFWLPSATGGADYRASIDVLPIAGTSAFYTQLVTLPTASINRVVTSFLGIYSVLAILIVIVAALLTRYLVTLAFRKLGQVEATAMSIASGNFSQRMTDIDPGTEVGRLKTAINAMLRRIDAAIAQRDATVSQMRRFIGDASHELRTPLVTVRGYAELYRMGAISGDEQVGQSMERIEKEAIRMGVLVEDLLALARLDERRPLTLTPVDLRPIARDAAFDTRAAAPLRTVTVTDTTIERDAPIPAPEPADDEPDDAEPARRRAGPHPTAAIAEATLSLLRRRSRPVPASSAVEATPLPSVQPTPDAVLAPGALQPIVRGDEDRIRQVVTNLLGNARRFTSDDTPIDLSVGVDAATRSAWIAIADHGEGIPEQLREKIFQRFWRADTSRARETGGSGLGLSIVASIVDVLHGWIDVTETDGGGATFRVFFPLAQPTEAAEHLLLETQPLPKLRTGS